MTQSQRLIEYICHSNNYIIISIMYMYVSHIIICPSNHLITIFAFDPLQFIKLRTSSHV